MAIKVHGHGLSPRTQYVILCLLEKDLEYEYVIVDLAKRRHKQQPYLSINPFGEVPAFEDGDLKLLESRAITGYIANAYADRGTPLISKDPKEMAVISMWIEIGSHRFDAASGDIYRQIVINPLNRLPTDEALVEKLTAQLEAVLDVYEARLAQSKYLAGDNFTLADLHHLPLVDALINKTKLKPLFEKRHHVRAWAANIMARPTWHKCLQLTSHEPNRPVKIRSLL